MIVLLFVHRKIATEGMNAEDKKRLQHAYQVGAMNDRHVIFNNARVELLLEPKNVSISKVFSFSGKSINKVGSWFSVLANQVPQ